MNWLMRMLFGAAIGCSLGAVQTAIETLTIGVLYDRFLLAPATFFNIRIYDAFTKLFYWLDLSAPTLSTLDTFIGQGVVPKFAIATDLLLVNFIVGAALGAGLGLVLPFVSTRLRSDGRRFATIVLLALVVVSGAVHIGMWAANLHLPVDPTLKTGLRNAARNFLHDGTFLSLVVLIASVPVTFVLFGLSRRRPVTASIAIIAPFAAAILYHAAALATAEIIPASPANVAGQTIAADYNVVLISIDSLRADHLSAYGYERETSPTIATLAQGGVLFRNTSSTTAWTLPGHVSILSGRSLLGHGVVTDAQSIGPDIPMIAESFQAAGYATHGIVSAPYVEARYGFDRGFDSYDDKTIQFATHGASYKEVTAPLLQKTAAAWLEANANKKFFLFLHYWDVHYDYAPGSPYDTMFDPHYDGSISGENFYFNPAVHAGMNPRDLEHLLALYDGEIRLVDDHLAKLRDVLAKIGVADKTIILVTSDHGDEFFEHGRKGHHRTLYDEILRVPLVLHVPGVTAKRPEVMMETSTIDIVPTLLGLTGLPVPNGVEGVDLSGISYRGEPEWDRRTIAELYRNESLNVQVSLRNATHKLIHHFNDRLAENYDIRADPGETARLPLIQAPAIDMMVEMSAWLNERWSAYRTRLAAGLDTAVTMDSETHERLKALGYVE